MNARWMEEGADRVPWGLSPESWPKLRASGSAGLDLISQRFPLSGKQGKREGALKGWGKESEGVDFSSSWASLS